jgi:hypothetical protein
MPSLSRRLFRGERPYPYALSLEAPLGDPSATFKGNAAHSGCGVGKGGIVVVIYGLRGQAKVSDPVVRPHAIDVVNLDFAVSVDINPCQTVRRSEPSAETDHPITMCGRVSGFLPSKSHVPRSERSCKSWPFFPGKVTRVRTIVQKGMQNVLRDGVIYSERHTVYYQYTLRSATTTTPTDPSAGR